MIITIKNVIFKLAYVTYQYCNNCQVISIDSQIGIIERNYLNNKLKLIIVEFLNKLTSELLIFQYFLGIISLFKTNKL